MIVDRAEEISNLINEQMEYAGLQVICDQSALLGLSDTFRVH